MTKKTTPTPKQDPDPLDGAKAIGCLFVGVVVLGVIFFFVGKLINHLRP